ncbi:MAG: class I SAM-dependent methyltransferase [Actinomycetota bacterium]|nr:MAG: class I SAM-dependent methyltransferase [Actinomycetota bacterium]
MDTESRYDWNQVAETPSHAYLAPAARDAVDRIRPSRVLDLGCGDGRLTARLVAAGRDVVGVDFSATGIARARLEHPEASFAVHALDDPLPSELRDSFELVTAIEVIEHMLLPRHLFARADEALQRGGRLLVTTPYHGYWKNLALSVTNKWDSHHTVGWDYGHIKFFSRATLAAMAAECGFRLVAFARVGRIPPIAASMVALFERTSPEV